MFPSRARAQAEIMSGHVLVDGRKIVKPGHPVRQESIITTTAPAMPYAGRGGLKLEKALDAFKVDPKAKTWIDVGASTGGFTDCLLQKGAAKVYCVDAGYGQLDWKLRNDPRVVVMEKTNARYLEKKMFPEEMDGAVVDVSFISLTKVLGPVSRLIKYGGPIIALVKPQFEAGRGKVGKGGIVRSETVRRETVESVKKFALEIGLAFEGEAESPIKGAKGNVEYLLLFRGHKT